MSLFRILEIDSWSQAIDICSRINKWIFRGQACASWPLATSLERIGSLFNCPTEKLLEREDVILREFRRRASHYDRSLNHNMGKLESLALLQHHGGATRLLDFTESFYVAAYFAMDSGKQENAAVWAINVAELHTALTNKLPEVNDNGNVLLEEMWELHELLLQSDKRPPMILSACPKCMNARLSVQQGLFLFPTDITRSFEENLTSTFDWNTDALQNSTPVPCTGKMRQIVDLAMCAVVKVIIPRKLHKRAMADLKKMNVTRASLFPGLDGLCQSLIHELREYEIDLDPWPRVTEKSLNNHDK